MRKNIIIVVLAALSLCACDIDRLPTTSMAGEEIQKDPADKLEALVNGMYAQSRMPSTSLSLTRAHQTTTVCRTSGIMDIKLSHRHRTSLR